MKAGSVLVAAVVVLSIVNCGTLSSSSVNLGNSANSRTVVLHVGEFIDVNVSVDSNAQRGPTGACEVPVCSTDGAYHHRRRPHLQYR